MRRIAALVILLNALLAPQAWAQSWEISALTGYVPSVKFDDPARGVDSAGIGSGFLWQFVAGRMFTSKWGAEVLWTEQFSAYQVESGGNTGDLFKMSILQLHANVVYQFSAGSRLQPFAFGGGGATFFSATDLQSEQKFSIGLGGGVKYFLLKDVAFRGQLRYTPTFLSDEATAFCDPFDFCQSTLRQFEFAGGVTFRF